MWLRATKTAGWCDPRLRTKGGKSDGPLGFGPLLDRPGQLLDLPAGFEYVVIQKGVTRSVTDTPCPTSRMV